MIDNIITATRQSPNEENIAFFTMGIAVKDGCLLQISKLKEECKPCAASYFVTLSDAPNMPHFRCDPY